MTNEASSSASSSAPGNIEDIRRLIASADRSDFDEMLAHELRGRAHYPITSCAALPSKHGGTFCAMAGSCTAKAMSWGHGAVQRALLAELQKQQQAIDTMSLLRIICDGECRSRN
jgi:hypothetical protein